MLTTDLQNPISGQCLGTFVGKVKWFDNKKGFGFIEYDANPNVDVFVHYSNINAEGYKKLAANQIVVFQCYQKLQMKANNGLYAKNVSVMLTQE